jgi:hypothetical protein
MNDTKYVEGDGSDLISFVPVFAYRGRVKETKAS